MACTSHALAAMAFVAIASASAQQAEAPSPAAPPVAEAPQPLLARPPDDAARTARLARRRAQLVAEIAAQEKYGHQEEFLAAVMGRPADRDTARFMKVSDGWLTTLSLQRFELWNTPETGRTKLRALDFELPDHPFQVVVDLDRELRSHGIDFVLVKFPTRAQLYPELLVKGLPAEGMAAFSLASRRFDLELIDAGVEVLDLGPLFVAHRFGDKGEHDDQLFLRTDPHWTPRAAELAARAVADALSERSDYVAGPAKEGVDFATRRMKTNYLTDITEAPPDADFETIPLTRVRTARNQPFDPEDEKSPLVVMGDSFVRVHNGIDSSFAHHLFRFVGRKVDVVAPKGAAERSTRDALRRKQEELAKKKTVIWLASEQVFRVGGAWTRLRLFE
jgi:hypothetical protein